MSSTTEPERDSDALLDGDAVRDALEQFDTIVDLDRRVEADGAASDPDLESEIEPDVEPDVEAEIAPDVESEIQPDIESEVTPDLETRAVIERHLETTITEQAPAPVLAAAARPKLVPRSAEPDLVGIDGDALAWSDDSSSGSRPVWVGIVVVALAIGAAAVVFVPHWAQRNTPPAAPTAQAIANANPVAYRAPRSGILPFVEVMAPAAGAIAGEPLPRVPSVAGPLEVPQALAAAVAPLAVRVATLSPPTARPTTTTTSSPVAAASPAQATVPAAIVPNAIKRVEPTFTAADALEQQGPRIVLRVLVDERGAPIRVMVKEGVPGTAGVAKAIDAILRTRYEVGQRQGQPVRAWVLETFELPRAS